MDVISPKTQIDCSRLQNSKLTFGKGTKPKPIYHYTSIGGLQGILERKTLRFTNIKYMNDKDEINAGLDSIIKDLEIPEKEHKNLRSSFINHPAQTFVCCFSLEEDSLPMWNYYTKEINNQGYNIEFDYKKLVESLLRNNSVLDGCDFAFGNVDYSKDNDSEYSRTFTTDFAKSMEVAISKLFLNIAQNSQLKNSSIIREETLKELEKKAEDNEKQQNNLTIYFYDGEKCSFVKDPSSEYLYFIKRDCFKQEKEFRIVITVPNILLPKMADNKVYKFRISNGVLVPYIELNFTEDVVKSITISPTVQSDLVELSIQDFMKYCKYDIQDFSEFIKHSNVPVRF